MRRALILAVFICITLSLPASADLTIFLPSYGGLSSTQVHDCVNGPEGEVVFATSDGLSFYDGANWTTYHAPKGYMPEWLSSDTVLSIEYGPEGALWIGTTLGLQTLDGHTFRNIADQHRLKNPAVIGLQRWDDAMWIETRNSGVHRVEGENWTWYKPFRPGSPASYDLEDMALDPMDRLLYCLSHDGLWAIGENVSAGFHPVTLNGMPLSGYDGVRTDPFGGVYLFNSTEVVHLGPAGRLTRVLLSSDLGTGVRSIRDLSPAPDGALWLATDRGIFCWADGGVAGEIDRADGIWSPVVKKVFVDCGGRCWYSTSTAVGYYSPENTTLIPITFERPARGT
ncbi:hypothetical protein RJ40_01595 [Methanofollis aquaemaris]|uniref:Two component regulator propeller n=1 Tax=Methanofollis aquaemaris TaxID=126734 RepID=A0A8A3S2Y8_9EURY|nr:hypothetical protein [Methanofollis aquaemaris]QSZ66283.1 hypothetical protein RJ40_01595 [Methanofollis aquaemaris]